MNYKNKGYYPINESKKAKDVHVVFLSSRAEKTTKSSNSMFFFEEAAKKAGLKLITIDPSSSVISKGADDNYNIVENGETKKTYTLSPKNTIIVPRRTVLKKHAALVSKPLQKLLSHIMLWAAICMTFFMLR